jgi:putative SOS response-associated peptidase YedK
MVIDSFYENVPKHLYEKRELAPGERESSTVLHFNPNSGEPMTIACLWSHWTHESEPELYSFAAITDEPPRFWLPDIPGARSRFAMKMCGRGGCRLSA